MKKLISLVCGALLAATGLVAVDTVHDSPTASAQAAQMTAPGNPRAQWDDPPTCFTGRGQWHFDGYGTPQAVVGYYTHAGQYSVRVGSETRYYWLYTVEIWNIYSGMTLVGWAQKHCGTVR